MCRCCRGYCCGVAARDCGEEFSCQYAVVELLTGVLFAGFYWLYFVKGVRGGDAGVCSGGVVSVWRADGAG